MAATASKIHQTQDPRWPRQVKLTTIWTHLNPTCDDLNPPTVSHGHPQVPPSPQWTESWPPKADCHVDLPPPKRHHWTTNHRFKERETEKGKKNREIEREEWEMEKREIEKEEIEMEKWEGEEWKRARKGKKNNERRGRVRGERKIVNKIIVFFYITCEQWGRIYATSP